MYENHPEITISYGDSGFTMKFALTNKELIYVGGDENYTDLRFKRFDEAVDFVENIARKYYIHALAE